MSKRAIPRKGSETPKQSPGSDEGTRESADRTKLRIAESAQSNPIAFWKSVAKFQRLR
jgi:hypothetical protein